MAPLQLRNIRKSYGPLEVVHGVNVDIEDGSFVVLVGPSGCGKSTLLRMIAGLEDLTSGEILIDGRRVNDEHPKDRDIAMVFQSYALYPHMTVEENMGFSLRMRKVPAQEKREKVRQAAKILNLEGLLDRYPRELSGGQRQRVAMGRAIVRDPKVFLFDEPLSNLDAKLRVQMRAEIRELHQRLKTTIVYVTHDQVEAMTMADTIVVMNEGNVEQVGKPLELYDRPGNLFVASFLGSPSMNLLNDRVSRDDGTLFETESGFALRLSEDVSSLAGRPIVLGVRPERLELNEAGSGMTVAVIEPTGSEVQVIFKSGTSEIVAAFHERVGLQVGQSVGLGVQPGALHFFDRDTGQRLDR
jgi:multiple sugar transport system ATP-binding protein